MTDFRPEPDFEAIAVGYLAAIDAVTDLCPVESISTRLPREWQAGDPAIRIIRVGGLPTEPVAQHLTRGRLQVEAFAETEALAFELASLVDVELRRIVDETFAGAVITSTAKDLPLANRPDPDSDSARFLFGVVLYGHSIAT